MNPERGKVLVTFVKQYMSFQIHATHFSLLNSFSHEYGSEKRETGELSLKLSPEPILNLAGYNVSFNINIDTILVLVLSEKMIPGY